MNIVVCGVQGTGKTTLSKMLAEKHGFSYINDYKICENIKDKKAIIDFVSGHDKFVVDLCYSLTPKDCASLENCLVYFLGFVSVDEKLLLTLMREKREDISLEKIKQIKKQGLKFKDECKKYNIKFFDVDKDRKIIIEQIICDIDKQVKL